MITRKTTIALCS